MQDKVLQNQTACPSCGKKVEFPLHACHVARDNFVVEWRDEDETESAMKRER